MPTMPASIRPIPDYESLLSSKASQVSKAVQDDARTYVGVSKNKAYFKRIPKTVGGIEVIVWHYAHGYKELLFASTAELDIWLKSVSGYGWKVEMVK